VSDDEDTLVDQPGAMSELVLETHDLSKKYGDRLAVDAVSMSVRTGEVYGFLGPNGAGKTTTLRMCLGLVHPTSGRARVLGRRSGDAEAMALTGALIEAPGFYPYLTGRANLQVLARYRGLADAAVDAALARVDLHDRAGDRFKAYSLGMKQRLGVAAALMGDPELIVLDEPTNGLDPGGMADMRALILELARSGHTVLLSSHLLAEVEEICDRVGVISRGRLLVESTVSELRGGRRLRVVATPRDRALEVCQHLTEAAELDGDAVLLDIPEHRTPEVVRALVTHGVDVHEAVVTERTLEEVFFEMTGTQDEDHEALVAPRTEIVR
jgi:ABC-2 type transport system ATP-binding protein